MLTQLRARFVVKALGGGLLVCSIHPVNLAIGPRMLDHDKAMLNAVFSAAHVEHVGHAGRRRPIGVARRVRELDAVVR